MEKEVRIVVIHNPLDPQSKTVETVPYGGEALAYYVDATGKLVTISGKVLPPGETAIVLPGDEVVIRPQIQKGFWAIFARVLLFVAAAIVTVITKNPALGMAIWQAGSMILNAVLPFPKAGEKTQLPTYTWDGAQTTAQQGLPIAVQYGLMGGDSRTGNVIESYTAVQANKSYMNILLCLGHGVAESIKNIRLNEQPIENYKNVQIEKRLGYLEQAPIDFFRDVVNDFAYSTKVTVAGGAQSFLLHRSDTTTIEVEVTFIKGIYRTDDSGKMKDFYVTWEVEYSLDGVTWSKVVRPRTTAAVGADYWVAVPSDAQFGEIGSTPVLASHPTALGHYEGEPFNDDVDLSYSDYAGGAHALIRPVRGYWTKNEAALSGGEVGEGQQGAPLLAPTSWTSVTKVTHGSTTEQIRDTVRISGLTPGQYWVRVTKKDAGGVVADKNDIKFGDELWVTSIKEISPDVINYGGMILLGIRAMATDQLSGGGLKITADVQMTNPETTGYKWSVAYDLPKRFYRLSDAAGNPVDSSGYGRNATAKVATTYQQKTLITSSPAKAARMDAGCSITIPAIVLADFTFECWVKPVNAYVGGGFGMNLFSGAGYIASLEQGGLVAIWNGGVIAVTAANSVPSGVVSHIVVRVKAGVATVYINGKPSALNNPVTTWPATTINTLFAQGAAHSENSWMVQAVAIYDYALRLGRIGQHYIMGTTPTNVLEDQACDNPAVVAIDVWANHVYGGGRKISEVNVGRLEEYADWNNDLINDGLGGTMYRNIVNGIFDSQTNIWEALAQIGTMSMSTFLLQGSKLSVISEKAMPVAQLFTMGNIMKGSFEENWLGSADRANTVVVEFLDEADGYKKNPIQVDSETALVAGEAVKPGGSVAGWGITDEAHAWHLGNFWLRSNKRNKRTIGIGAQIEAVHCQVGDHIMVAHQVPKWGDSGRILDTNGLEFKLDQEVVLLDATAYKLGVRLDYVMRWSGVVASIDDGLVGLTGFPGGLSIKRLSKTAAVDMDAFVGGSGPEALPVVGVDAEIQKQAAGFVTLDSSTGLVVGDMVYLYDTDVYEEKAITVPAGGLTSDTVTVAAPFSGKVRQFDPFVVSGPQAPIHLKVFDISRDGDYRAKLTAVEYDETMYDAAIPVLSGAPGAGSLPYAVAEMAMNESMAGFQRYVNATWRNGLLTAQVRVYVAVDGGPLDLVQTVQGLTRWSMQATVGDEITVVLVGGDGAGRWDGLKTAPSETWIVGTGQASTPLNPQGSILPGQTVAFTVSGLTYDAGSGLCSATISWSTTDLLRADGTFLHVLGGSLTWTNLLNPTTVYHAYMRVLVSTGVVSIGSGNPPAIPPTTLDGSAAMNCRLDGYQQLGRVDVTTSDSAGAGGGGGGGDICVEHMELVLSKSRGWIHVGLAISGEWIADEVDGKIVWRRVRSNRLAPCGTWRQVEGVLVAPCDEVMYKGLRVRAYEVSEATVLHASHKAVLELDADHDDDRWYIVGGHMVKLRVHNVSHPDIFC
jgi:hypothetical protein